VAEQSDPRQSLRASDADRDRVAVRLRAAYAEGRLTSAEFDERVTAALQARTLAELDALTLDLPADSPADPRAEAGSAEPGRSSATPVSRTAGDVDRPVSSSPPDRRHRSAAESLRAWASVSVIVWGIWLASAITGGGLQGLWPVWVTVPWGAVVLARSLRD
jgi:hypothetical protein